MYQVGRGWARRLVGIRISPDRAVVSPGETVAFKASAVLSDSTLKPVTVTWSATGGRIDSSGLFTAGSSTGSFHVVGAQLTIGLADTAVVVDTAASGEPPAPAVSLVSVSPSSTSIQVGDSIRLTATAKAADGATVSGLTFAWTSSNPGVATVTSAGVVRGLVAGSVTVTASAQGVSGRAAVAVTAPVASAPPPATVDCSSSNYARLVPVSTASQLTSALANAQPGDLIELAAGTYTGHFRATVSGTPSQRIVLCGPRTAILDGGDYTSATFWLRGVSYWTLSGFRARRSLVAVLGETASQNIVDSLEIETTGYGGLSFRVNSKHNVIQKNYIHDTGKAGILHYGEGVYLGSSQANWCTYTGCNPDRTDSNTVTKNYIGPNVTAEMIDVKEGTTGTVISGNHFDGAGRSAGTLNLVSWIVLFGNGVKDSANTAINQPIQHGYKIELDNGLPGWGQNNSFQYDTLYGGGASGYGFWFGGVDKSKQVVKCNNVVTGFSGGLSNVACAP
jgi:hypothetical protein